MYVYTIYLRCSEIPHTTLATVTIVHTYLTNQMLLAEIHANSIHGLRDLTQSLESWISSIRRMVRPNYAGVISDRYAKVLLRSLGRTICHIAYRYV